MSVVGALVVAFTLTDFPEDSKFLSEEEKSYVIARINHDIGRVPSNILNLKVLLRIFSDWRFWCLWFPGYHISDFRTAMSFCHVISTGALGLFTPTILVTFGYTAVKAVLYTIPIHVCSVTWGILNAIIADRLQHRSTLLLISLAISMTGVSMAGWALENHNVRLAGIFLAHMGIQRISLST